ncbi:MAG TPA: alpha/beta fold hydrolase [Hyphomicrobiaceae bacterium]|nr:alpha/beta fold hydrolase [Hyphomicrobiaceae bacterium]
MSGEHRSEPEAQPAAPEPAAVVARIAGTARQLYTPCGDGSMVWRVWGAGEPLILLHGGSGSWTHWLRNIPELSRHYQLWVPDLPGLGASAMPPEPLLPASVAEVVVAGLEALIPQPRPLRLVGFSFGGHIAGLTAARMRGRILDLTLVGVAALGLSAEPRDPFAKRRTGMTAAEIAAVFRQNLEVLMFADPDNIDALAIHLQAENITRARFRSRPFATSDGLAKALANVTARLTTIWGTRDIIARTSLATRLEILRRHHPELEVRLIEGAGHWVAYEAAERFNAALLALLAADAGGA